MLNYRDINKLFDDLFPIARSITGKGYRDSLKLLSNFIKFKTLKYPTNKKVFDWTVPKEWVINDAYIKFKGKKIVDFKKNNLHVVNYSIPVKKKMSLKELNKNLFSIKKYPKIIPYVTSYYKKTFGFCISHEQRKKLKNVKYDVLIDSKFINGNVVT